MDGVLARLQLEYDTTRADHPVPSPADPVCPGPALSAPASFATPEAERAWARSVLDALPDSCVVSVGGGEVKAVKPANRQSVYALAAVPGFAAADARTRLLKSEYLFSTYSPDHAVLTGGNLCIRGSVLVDAVREDVAASVHANADVATSCSGNGVGAGSSEIEGRLTASGTASVNTNLSVSGGVAGGQPKVRLPSLDPRPVYLAEHAKFPGRWFDLCPDGSVRAPTPAGPCAGATVLGQAPFQGWSFSAGSGGSAPVWSMTTRSSPYPGVYYVFEADAVVGGHGASHDDDPPWNATVLAESAPAGGPLAACGKRGGNITWKLEHVRNVLPGIVFLAEGDLIGSANSRAENGLLAAGDQVVLSTSSASVRGAVIAGDSCREGTRGNEVQGVRIEYDGSVEAALSSVVRSVLWLEYVG
ncbi:MAG: hypothetical protein M3P96_16660 [Actinomycetota bacterium]|nr:hypothetical protein [Actinomycetota bacterium]